MAEQTRKRAEFEFDSTAHDMVTDYDVVMAYEVFLGRHPESSSAIDYHKSATFSEMIAGFLASREFEDNVYNPLKFSRPVMRGDYKRPPSEDQLSWLLHYIVFSDKQKQALRSAESWSEFFKYFLAFGGLDQISGEQQAGRLSDPVVAPAIPAPEAEKDLPADPTDGILSQLNEMRDFLARIESAVRALRK